MKVCSVEGCDQPHNCRGWCETHYNRWRRHGDPHTVLSSGPPRRVCAVDGCGEWCAGHGYCSKHYQRWKANGDPLVVRRVARYDGEPCSIDRCDKPAASRGWCKNHYQMWRTTGSPIPKIPTRHPCSIDGCELPHASRGWCAIHYARWRRHGDPKTDNRSTGCSICSHPDRANIELMMLSGEPRDVILDRYGFSSRPLVRHRDCLGLPRLGHTQCRVCQHDDHEEIDDLIDRRDEWVIVHASHRPPPELQWLTISQRFGFDAETPAEASKVFAYHRSAEHAQVRALYELGRLNALKETA